MKYISVAIVYASGIWALKDLAVSPELSEFILGISVFMFSVGISMGILGHGEKK